MKAIEEGAEVGVAEDDIIPGGEEVTTGDGVSHRSLFDDGTKGRK